MHNDIFKLVDGKFVISEGYNSIRSSKELDEFGKPRPNPRRKVNPSTTKVQQPAEPASPAPVDQKQQLALPAGKTGTGALATQGTKQISTTQQPAPSTSSNALPKGMTVLPPERAQGVANQSKFDSNNVEDAEYTQGSSGSTQSAAAATNSQSSAVDKQEQGAIGKLLKNDGLQNTVNTIKSIEAWMTKNGLKLIPQAVQQTDTSTPQKQLAAQANPVSETKIIRNPSLIRRRAK